MKWLFNSCRRYQQDISLLAIGVLAEQERVRAQAHLAVCPACRNRLTELSALAGRCQQLGSTLPEVDPSAMLRRRWMKEVHELGHSQNELPNVTIVAWLTGRRLAWGCLAAVWALVLFFRFSSPDAPNPTLVATPLPSLRSVLLALKVEPHESPFGAEANQPVLKHSPKPDALPPRSERPGGELTIETKSV